MSTFRVALIAILFVTAIGSSAVFAGLVVDPTEVGGAGINLLMDGAPFQLDPTATINTGHTFTGKFYGASVGDITVAENGNLNFTNNDFFFPIGLEQPSDPFYLANVYTARIAPLWDDFLMASESEFPGFLPLANRVVEHSVPGSYLAVTWENVALVNDSQLTPPPQQTFQVLWFEAPTTIKGYNFFADDIVFGYRGSTPGTNSFGHIEGTVGITNGGGLHTSLPGDTPTLSAPNGDGYISHDGLDLYNNPTGTPALLAWEADSFLLFRPKSNPTTGYDASKEYFPTAVPEPATAFGPLAVLVGWSALRRRRLRRPSKQLNHASMKKKISAR